MGQGLHTKIQQIAADSLGVTLDRVRVMPTRTDKVPNTSATAASAGTDLNGAAVADACAQLKARLAAVASGLLACDESAVRFDGGIVSVASGSSGTVSSVDSGFGRTISFAALCEAAYRQRVP